MSAAVASDILAAIRRKHFNDAVVREVVIDDPFEAAVRRRHEIERARAYGAGHAERIADRYARQGKAVADDVPEGWSYRGSIPRRRIDALILTGSMTTAVEIKVTRSDFRRENDAKRRAWRAVTNRFIYAAPVGVIPIDEVPKGCGLWEFDASKVQPTRWGHALTSVVRAISNPDPLPMPRQILVAMAYRVSRQEFSA